MASGDASIIRALRDAALMQKAGEQVDHSVNNRVYARMRGKLRSL